MSAEGCNIYLDPWDKTDLEGHALLTDRIPDTPERSYRGVTCERWLVRFQEDQDATPRWLDYSDAIAWDPPAFQVIVYQTQMDTFTFTNALGFTRVQIGNIQTSHIPADDGIKPVLPKIGRIRHLALSFYVSAKVGTPPLVRIYCLTTGQQHTIYDIPDSNTVGNYVRFSVADIVGADFSAGDTLLVTLQCIPGGADTLTIVDALVDIHIQWGDFT